MLDKIIHFSINNKFIVGLFTLALVLVSVYNVNRLPIDALPDITNNQVQIITTAPTWATQEVQQFITYPIEQTMKTIPKIVEMRSFSQCGLSLITLVFFNHGWSPDQSTHAKAINLVRKSSHQ